MSDRIEAAARVLHVLDVLFQHFANGLSPGEVAKAAKISPPAATRSLATLEHAGFAERIPETGRWRVSHRIARKALQILRSMEHAQARLTESLNRIDPDHH